MQGNITYTFEKIYKGESDSIFRFCLVRVSNREQALDIMQETFLRMWKSIQEGKEIINNRAFLFTIAHRLIIDWYRKKKSISLDGIMYNGQEMEYDLRDETTTTERIERDAEGRYILEKINELAPTHRDPVYLRFVEGLSPPEIGSLLSVSSNVASVRVHRGLLELRRKTGYAV